MKFTSPLDNVKVASPCKADWNQMSGNDTIRFCGSCEMNVYNLSGMSKRAAEDLLARAEGRMCVRFFRRTDGSIITRNCPVGFAAVKQRFQRIGTAVLSSVLGFTAGVGLFSLFGSSQREVTMGTVAERLVQDRASDPVVGEVDTNRQELMGKMVYELPRNPRKLPSVRSAR
jgi:hypothetical protein